MNKKWIAVSILALGITGTGIAQTREKTTTDKKNKEDIIIRKKGDSKEKLTIVVDGDNITVNGKDIKDLSDTDIEVLRDKHVLRLAPKIRARIMPGGRLKMFEGDDDLLKHFNKALLGVMSEKDEKGAKIVSVSKETAADKAGLQKGDIITKLGDDAITGSNNLYEAIGKYKPEDKVVITYLRDGKEHTVTATLGKNPAEPDFEFDFNDDFNRNFNMEIPRMPRLDNWHFNFDRKPRLGLEIQDLENGKGVKVLHVSEDAPAAKAGLQKDDIILQVDGKDVNTVEELKTVVKNAKEGETLKLTYHRDGKSQAAEVKFPRKLKTAEL